jgi:hypothetical protein
MQIHFDISLQNRQVIPLGSPLTVDNALINWPRG